MSLLNDTLFSLQRCAETGRVAPPGLNELRAQVPGPILAHFDRQLAQGRKGMAEARNGVCCGCHLRLPLGLAAFNTDGTDDLRVCENCGAYLFFPPGEAPAKPAGVSRPRRRYQAALVT